MKRLLLFRHAKAQSGSFQVNDFKRTLTDKGKVDAELISYKLKLVEPSVDKIYSSNAIRAISTARILSKEYIMKVEGDDRLYDASPSFMKTFLESLNDQFTTVAVVGHNPTISFLIDYYTGDERSTILPTSGVGIIEFEIESWAEISYNSGTLKKLFSPKQLI